MHDAHAPVTLQLDLREEFPEQAAGFVGGQAVEIQFTLDGVLALFQILEHFERNVGLAKAEFFPAFQADLTRPPVMDSANTARSSARAKVARGRAGISQTLGAGP